MTIEHEKEIRIPVWVVSIVIPLVISILSFVFTMSATSSKYGVKINRNEKEIEVLKTQKTDNKTVDMIVIQLNRIENKLDKIQSK